MTEDVLLRVIGGDAEPLEVRRVERWRAESEAHDLRYRELAMIWKATGRSGSPAAGVDRPGPSVEVVRARGEALRRRDARMQRMRRWSARVAPWAAAATIAAVGLLLRGGDAPDDGTPGAEFVAGPTEATTVTFPDGSFVRLDAGARVRFAGDGPRREAWVTGRAFFGITEDSARPFEVHTGLGEVAVLGTRFEVREDELGLRVVVVEGRVAVSAPGGRRAELAKGQVAELARNGDFSVRTVDDVYELLDWEGGLLLFQGTALAQVAEEVAAHFGVPVTVQESLRDRSLTAWFEDDPLEEVVESICLLVEARCEVATSGVRIGH